ncbi:uncharacterized protein LOC129230217 [Uloborus diversus]|uniref:uncharacterized protein LOC129230217 n=1 Tax=Uloborus diversus TaxID=327109 RepID=UPI002409F1E7|nr:uncharacterized protein LOC129230217 [Uloborus diversus]
MTLEELSSTDVECEWAVRKKDVEKCYAVVPLQDFCHVEQTTDIVYTISDEQRSRFRRSLLSACPASAAALHVRGRRHANASFDVPTTSFQTEDALMNKILARDLIWEEQKLEALPEELKSYYKDNVQVSSPKAYNLAKSVQQQSSTWLAERSHRITGSVCYELYTYTKNKAPNWEKKIKTMLSQEFQNTAMVYGTETETVAKEQYMLKCGMTIYNFGLLVVPAIPWLVFSPDGIAVDGDSVVLLEIKCPIVHMSDDKKILDAACTCPRGKGLCHHMAALLIYGHHNMSVTDVHCGWIKTAAKAAQTTKTVADLFPRASPSPLQSSEDQKIAAAKEVRDELARNEEIVSFSWLLKDEPEKDSGLIGYEDLLRDSDDDFIDEPMQEFLEVNDEDLIGPSTQEFYESKDDIISESTQSFVEASQFFHNPAIVSPSWFRI